MRFLIYTILILANITAANADWREAKITSVAVGYDGKTIAFQIAGWIRNDCTCYPTWSSSMCLDPARESYQFEKSMVLMARARDMAIHVNIDEASCQVIALEEHSWGQNRYLSQMSPLNHMNQSRVPLK